MKRSKRHVRIVGTVVLLISVGCVGAPGEKPALPSDIATLTVEDILRLPLEQGVTGYDRVSQSLRSIGQFSVLRKKPPILKTERALKLSDEHVVVSASIEDYEGYRKLGLALDGGKCFPLARAGAITGVVTTSVQPQEHDNEHGRTFIAKRNGMLVIFSTPSLGSECVGSITLTQSAE